MSPQDSDLTTAEREADAQRERVTQRKATIIVARTELDLKRDILMQSTHTPATVAVIPVIVPLTTLPPLFLIKDNILKSVIVITTTEIFQTSGTHNAIPLTTILAEIVHCHPMFNCNPNVNLTDENIILFLRNPPNIFTLKSTQKAFMRKTASTPKGSHKC